MFLTNFEPGVFGNVIKHCLECLIYKEKKKDKIVKIFAYLIQTLSRSRLPLLALELLMTLRNACFF